MTRDDFARGTKRVLAERVGWRCSFPECRIPTVGPHSSDETRSVNLGEAAHITAAAPNGPRYDTQITPQQRKHARNGIWMCRHHAKLVDADDANFAEETLRQWKRLAEGRAYTALEKGSLPLDLEVPTTLIAFGHRIVFRGIWIAGAENLWKFRCVDFVRGDPQLLRDEIAEMGGIHGADFVVVESQGDGRIISGTVEWNRVNDAFELLVPVEPRAQRTNPLTLGTDLALGKDGDLVIEGGSMKTVKGLDSAVQRLSTAIGTMIGERVMNPRLGSLASLYYHRYHSDTELLGRLLKLEFARLATIPNGDKPPPLNFVWRVNSVTVPTPDLAKSRRLRTTVDLVWTNGERWSGEVPVYVHESIEKLPEWAYRLQTRFTL